MFQRGAVVKGEVGVLQIADQGPSNLLEESELEWAKERKRKKEKKSVKRKTHSAFTSYISVHQKTNSKF